MVRIENWDLALFEALAAAEAQPFSWADGGCMALALDCIAAMTGTLPIARPDLRDALDAKRWLRKNGHADLAAAMAAHLAEIHLSAAGRGDIGIIERDGNQTAAVCAGLHWVARSEQGLVRVSRAEITRAFRV